MKKVFFKCLDFLLFSNIFIALGAVAQGLLTYRMLNLQPSPLVCGFLFFATLSTYSFCILTNKPANYLNSPHSRILWFFTHHRLNIILTILSSLALIPLFLMLGSASQILMVFLGLVSVAYSLPLTVGKRVFCLRHIGGLKLFIIAFVWSVAIVWFPVSEANINIPAREIIILISKQFVFYIALTLPFDIRDLFEDRASNLKTLPTIFGSKKAYLLSFILLIMHVILLACSQIVGYDTYFWSSILSVLLAAWLIWKSKSRNSQYYYFLFLDGVLIAQYVFLLMFDWWL